MPSPFPGMDPYLEGRSYWGGLHLTMIVALRAALTPQLPRGYFAEVDQYVWLEAEDDPERRWVGPDVFVSRESGKKKKTAPVAAAGTSTPTVTLTLPTPKKRGKRYIGIRDAKANRVVTVVELLSPSDKSKGKDGTNYLTKREEYLAAGVNLVEIDLLRNGLRPPAGDPDPPAGDYYILVSRAADFPRVDLWAFTVRDPIPVVPVPLKAGDPELSLPVRSALDRAYDDAGYDREIDYSKPPRPLLRGADAAWAADLLKKPAKRKK